MIVQDYVPVSGIGCLCAAGLTLDACLDFLYRGERFPGPPTKFTSPFSPAYPVFEVPDHFWKPERFRTGPGVRTVQLALTALREALDNAGISPAYLCGKRVGVCIGTNVAGGVSNPCLTGPETLADCAYLTPDRRYSASNPALAIAREFHLSGPLQTVVTACSAGGDAIGLGASWVRLGLCDLVIAGGADELFEITYNGFISLMNSDDGPCRPFDTERKGLNLGEGAALMILESEASLRERTGTPRAFLMGYGSAGDAYHLTAPDPDGRGLRRALSDAMESGGVSATDIAFINAHGTGTPDNDRIESRLFADLFPGVPFLSTKGYTGHTLGAAGAVEAAFTIGCLERQQIPPSVGFAVPDPELPVSPVTETTAIEGTIALSETLAFGGNNAVLLLGTERGPR